MKYQNVKSSLSFQEVSFSIHKGSCHKVVGQSNTDLVLRVYINLPLCQTQTSSSPSISKSKSTLDIRPNSVWQPQIVRYNTYSAPIGQIPRLTERPQFK